MLPSVHLPLDSTQFQALWAWLQSSGFSTELLHNGFVSVKYWDPGLLKVYLYCYALALHCLFENLFFHLRLVFWRCVCICSISSSNRGYRIFSFASVTFFEAFFIANFFLKPIQYQYYYQHLLLLNLYFYWPLLFLKIIKPDIYITTSKSAMNLKVLKSKL